MQIQIPDARIGDFEIQKGKSNVKTFIFPQCTDTYVQITYNKEKHEICFALSDIYSPDIALI